MIQIRGIIQLIIMRIKLVLHILKIKELLMQDVMIVVLTVVQVVVVAVAAVVAVVRPVAVVAVQTDETEICDSMAHNRQV